MGYGDGLTYAKADERLGKRNSRKIANNTYLERHAGYIAVRLHRTEILCFYPDGSVRYDQGGYDTVTTRDRMNRFGAYGWQIYSDRSTGCGQYLWRRHNGARHFYFDGMTILSNGLLDPEDAKRSVELESKALEEKRQERRDKDRLRREKQKCVRATYSMLAAFRYLAAPLIYRQMFIDRVRHGEATHSLGEFFAWPGTESWDTRGFGPYADPIPAYALTEVSA